MSQESGYRVYCHHGVNKVVSAEWVDAQSDQEAIALVEATYLNYDCELWGQTAGRQDRAVRHSFVLSVNPVRFVVEVVSDINRNPPVAGVTRVLNQLAAIERAA